MKKILLLLAVSTSSAFATPQTSDSDLKAVQSPPTGFQISNLTTSQLDSTVFKNCTMLTNDSSSAHPINATGTLTLAEPPPETGWTHFVKGKITTFTFTGVDEFTTSATVTTGGVVSALVLNCDSDDGISTCNFTTTQTAPLSASAVMAYTPPGVFAYAGNASVANITANSVSSFTLAGYSPGDETLNQLGISVTSATAVDMSNYDGNGDSGNGESGFGITVGNPATFLVASSITLTNGSDTWNGSWTNVTFTNNILVACDNGGSSGGTLTVQGPTPTGAGATAATDLAADNVTVITN